MDGSERGAVVSALSGAVIEVARAVESVQHAVARRMQGALGPTYGVPVAGLDRMTSGVHATIRETARLVDLVATPVLAVTAAPHAAALHETRRGTLTLGALGSAWGDRLVGRTAALAPPMTLRHAGRPIEATPDALAAAYSEASNTVVVFVHGLGGTELAWGSDESFATQLTDETGASCLLVRYTTGRPVHANGRDLGQLLDQVFAAWPVPINRLVLVGHSMGGLVLRSALALGEEADLSWIPLVSDVFYLGAPHHGAPLERGAAWVSATLRRLPETTAFARLLDTRSAGVKDLRHGALQEADWAGFDPDSDRDDHTEDVPLLPSANHHFVAATLPRDGRSLLAGLVGDVMVSPSSATGTGATARRTPFPADRARFIGRAHHLDLLDHPEVYALLSEALRPSCPGSS